MIGHDDESEEVNFKVADRRKFNSDGSVRDGVTLDAAPVTAKAPRSEPEREPDRSVSAPPDEDEQLDDHQISEAAGEADEIPGTQDPASFVNFLSTLATNAAAALGAIPHPATGQRSLDLETGKYWLDVLAMLRDKTKGNLHAQESRLIEGLLADLRMQYVQIVRATEEKLKAQAAEKLSGADILGKK